MATKQISENHTSKYLAEEILSILVQCKIDLSKVVCITTDHVNNIKKKLVMICLDPKSILDALHSLNLLVNESITNSHEVLKVIGKVKAIVGYFKHSNKALDKLFKLQ